jgi:hypothetical protein
VQGTAYNIKVERIFLVVSKGKVRHSFVGGIEVEAPERFCTGKNWT